MNTEGNIGLTPREGRGEKINVLNHGFVQLVHATENAELFIVNAARVSFGNEKTEIDAADKRLISYLVRNKHDSPFRHVQITLKIKAPEFVLRQLYKHVVGIAYTPEREPDSAWNEISGRYVEYPDEFYYPDIFRKQSKNNKQATIYEEVEEADEARRIYTATTEHAYNSYKQLLDLGVGREIARTVLPLTFYTEVIWTASLQAVLNFILLRDHEGAQYEIRLYARAVKEIISKVAPITMKVWSKHRG